MSRSLKRPPTTTILRSLSSLLSPFFFTILGVWIHAILFPIIYHSIHSSSSSSLSSPTINSFFLPIHGSNVSSFLSVHYGNNNNSSSFQFPQVLSPTPPLPIGNILKITSSDNSLASITLLQKGEKEEEEKDAEVTTICKDITRRPRLLFMTASYSFDQFLFLQEVLDCMLDICNAGWFVTVHLQVYT